uniref:Uncharacterized protein n=1 Tax=Psilocybe cubensis TaxID=181762 RepID=A0A8H7XVD7_PSICU
MAPSSLSLRPTQIQPSVQTTTTPRETRAVAAVFVLVGLAAAAIILYLLFALRRRRRTLRLEHDTAVSATLAAAGFHRTPLDDDDDPAAGARHSRLYSGVGSSIDDPFQARAILQRRSSSGLAMSSVPSASAGRTSAYLDDNGDFNPYASGDYILPAAARDGANYLNNGTQAPPNAALVGGMRRDRSNSSGLAEMSAHTHNYSNSGSFEPLLASYYRRSMGTGNPPSPVLPLVPLGASAGPDPAPDVGQEPNTVRFPPAYSSSHGHEQPSVEPLVQISGDDNGNDNADKDAASSVYSSNSLLVDERLDPGLRLRQRLQRDTSTRDLRDEEDYSRPVLGVRNLPDAASQVSA